jgi:probable HAF family extracellular repeat protein
MRLFTLFAWSPWLLTVSTASAAVFNYDYFVTDLGTFGKNTYAYDINNAGQIVGASETDEGFGRAFVWQNGTMTPLPQPSGIRSIGYGINESGRVAGAYENSSFQLHAAAWQGPTFSNLGGGPYDPFYSVAYTANELGTVVGNFRGHAVYWDVLGVIHELTTPVTTGGAQGVNNLGQIVGRYDYTTNVSHPFVWEGGVLTDLGTLGGPNGAAYDINDAGQIVGWADKTGGGQRGFRWSAGMIHDLGVLPGTSNSQAYDQNNLGQIVGASGDNLSLPYNNRGVLWDNGQVHDLTAMLPPGWQIISAQAINDQGQIVGWGSFEGDSRVRGLLLTPVPEPAGISMAILATAHLVRRGRRLQRIVPRASGIISCRSSSCPG